MVRRLAYEFLKGSIPQSAAVVLGMREKHPPYMCFFLLCGGFCGNYTAGLEEGRGEAGLLTGEAF